MAPPAAAPALAAAPAPADPLAGVPIDPTRPIPTGDDEVAYARWPADEEESRKRHRWLDGLEDEIGTLAAHVTAADYRLLVKIRAFDRWQGWHVRGFKSCAKWLSHRIQITPGAARERVRVARALEHLPLLSDAMRTGKLSYSCLRALTRVATPENEEKLLDLARVSPASALERLVRGWKQCQRSAEELVAEEEERHRGRELWLGPAADGSYRIHGRLDPEVGAALQKALEAAEERLYRSASEGEEADPCRETPSECRRADALGLVAEAALGPGLGGEEAGPVGRAERFQVVVRVTEETLRGEPLAVGDEPPEIEGGPFLSPETARRLACDCSTVEVTRTAKGDVLDVGRKSRRPPVAMRRALDSRDRTCRFPGCGSRYCDSHHIHHWGRGGPTALENLVLLCWHHHRRVHEGGWRVERDEAGELHFHAPDGRELPAVPERPTAPAHPIRVMERAHAGLGIGPDTPTPDWDGLPMDYDLALEWLWGDGWALSFSDPDPSAEPQRVPTGPSEGRSVGPEAQEAQLGEGTGKGTREGRQAAAEPPEKELWVPVYPSWDSPPLRDP